MSTVSTKLDLRLKAKLLDRAAELGVTPSQLLRELIAKELEGWRASMSKAVGLLLEYVARTYGQTVEELTESLLYSELSDWLWRVGLTLRLIEILESEGLSAKEAVEKVAEDIAPSLSARGRLEAGRAMALYALYFRELGWSFNGNEEWVVGEKRIKVHHL